MSDRFFPVPAGVLARWMAEEYQERNEMLGIPGGLFWDPRGKSLQTRIFSKELETPLGTAAGPHTQLASNIAASWLVGGRFIELKTVQTLDELDVAKPCIDAEDVAFNCEWSQELKLEQSLDEYVKAWVLLHVLGKKLWDVDYAAQPGFVFNMSVGYNLEGILKPNVQNFLDGMADAAGRILKCKEEISESFPEALDIQIPPVLSDNVTLSTMHGCPPEEIEQIAHYLLAEKGYHTTVKMNPTLLGPEMLRDILQNNADFKGIDVPDAAFEHDTKYDDAVQMIRRLGKTAAEKGLHFGLKLTNTLEVRNHRDVFPGDQKMMYMSGRALHPLSVALAKRITDEFGHTIPISFSGGGDAFNVVKLLGSGLYPVTVCTDLLKPGGYARMFQYLENIEAAMNEAGVEKIEALAASNKDDDFRAKVKTFLEHEVKVRNVSPASERGEIGNAEEPAFADGLKAASRRACLDEYLRELLQKRGERPFGINTKNNKVLGWFDCVEAPCTVECPANQDVPEYMRLVQKGGFSEAHEVIKKTNALSRTTGAVCDHPCTVKCVRNHYDEPLSIREIKRAAAAYGSEPEFAGPGAKDIEWKNKPPRVALIGAGPASLSAAYYLAGAGCTVAVFDEKEIAGGMAASVIPRFRLPDEDLLLDVDAISAVGATFHFGKKAGRDFTLSSLLKEGWDAVFIGVGAQTGTRMGIESEDAQGVMDGLEFLDLVKRDKAPAAGEHVLIVGGGNSAMDAARTARRVAGPNAEVAVVYRRTRTEMPADLDEIEAVCEEGVEIMELTNPVAIIKKGNRISGVRCVKMKLGQPDRSGRPRPVPVENSEFEIQCTTLIVSIGQTPAVDFAAETIQSPTDSRNLGRLEIKSGGKIVVNPDTRETSVTGIFAGGDAVRGPSTIIRAATDGRQAALAIISRYAKETKTNGERGKKNAGFPNGELMERKSRRVFAEKPAELPVKERRGFKEVAPVVSREHAVKEAERCLSCDLMCSICVTVCPNRANQAYFPTPCETTLPVYIRKESGLELKHEKTLSVLQETQIVNIADLCNECGNCRTFCPSSGAPYKDKPRMYLDPAGFEADSGDAFHLDLDSAENLGIRFKDRDGVHSLIQKEETRLFYEGPKISAHIDKSNPAEWKIEKILPGESLRKDETADLGKAFHLDVLLGGLMKSLNHFTGLNKR